MTRTMSKNIIALNVGSLEKSELEHASVVAGVTKSNPQGAT